MFRKTIFGGALALAAFAAPASAQEAPVRVTYEQALDLALEQSTALERARNDVGSARLDVSDARASFLPDLRLSLSADQSYGRSFSENEGEVLNETNEAMDGRVATSVTVFDGFANTSRLDGAELEAEAALSDMERTRQTVVFDVITGFLELIAAEEQVAVFAEALAAQEQQERDVRLLVDGGRRPISDLYQQQANVAAARVSLIEGRRTAALAEVNLVQTLRLDPAAEYEFVAPPLPDSIVTTEQRSLDELLRLAWDNRADIVALERRVAAADQQVDVAQSGRWPTVAVSASYGTAYTTASDFVVIEQLDQRRGGSIGIGLSMPLFDRGVAGRETEQAELQEENARLALVDQRQTVALEVRRALLDRDAAVERLAAAQARVAAAQRALTATQQRYDAGVATLLEVTQARADMTAATSDLVNARYTLLFQEESLDYYAGEMGTETAIGD